METNDEIAALASTLRDVAKENPKLAEPIAKLAKNIRRLAKEPENKTLMMETSIMAKSLLVALGKLPPFSGE